MWHSRIKIKTVSCPYFPLVRCENKNKYWFPDKSWLIERYDAPLHFLARTKSWSRAWHKYALIRNLHHPRLPHFLGLWAANNFSQNVLQGHTVKHTSACVQCSVNCKCLLPHSIHWEIGTRFTLEQIIRCKNTDRNTNSTSQNNSTSSPDLMKKALVYLR